MERRDAGTPLNCIDKALLALYSKDEPMVNHCILTIDGAVDLARLRSALLTVLLRHPSLRSTIHTGLFRQVREATSNYGSDILSVRDLVLPQDLADANRNQIGTRYESRLSEWMNRPLDPGKELPCRVLLLRRTLREFSLVFTCHHSAADGLHLLRFIGEVIQDYNGATENSLPSTYSLTDGKRDELVALAQACRLKVKHFYLRMIASLAHRFLLAPLSPNARICRTSSRRSAEMHFYQGSLNPHELGQIKSRSKSVGATVNDILLAAGFRTVEQWNSAHGKPSRKISIMVPVSIGNPMSSPVIANQVSFISVSTTQKERSDPEELLREVRQRTSHMLKNGIAFSIVYAVSFCTRLSPRIPKFVAGFLMATRIYLDSILLTNLGLIWPEGATSREGGKMGSAKITSVIGLAPVVSPMGISLCPGTYRDHLYIALTYKTASFSKAEARTFLNLYLHELRGYQRTPEGLLIPEVRQREPRVTAPV
jgi:NRPS condensation-like uncharacterized protein